MAIYVVTGAGRGLGQALALALANRGVDVAAFGRDTDALARTAAMASAPDAGRIHPVLCDVADPNAVARAFDLVDRIGPLDGVINNAATHPRRDTLQETHASVMATMATNFGGYAACSYAALDRFTAQGHGRILNVSTFAHLAPAPASGAYAASKGAALILSQAMVADLSHRFPRIIISNWMPGRLATDMGVPDGLNPAIAAQWGAQLALSRDTTLQGSIWEMDSEVLPPRGLRRRLLDRLRGHKPRRL